MVLCLQGCWTTFHLALLHQHGAPHGIICLTEKYQKHKFIPCISSAYVSSPSDCSGVFPAVDNLKASVFWCQNLKEYFRNTTFWIYSLPENQGKQCQKKRVGAFIPVRHGGQKGNECCVKNHCAWWKQAANYYTYLRLQASSIFSSIYKVRKWPLTPPYLAAHWRFKRL